MCCVVHISLFLTYVSNSIYKTLLFLNLSSYESFTATLITTWIIIWQVRTAAMLVLCELKIKYV
jgi:hypothetical protein